MEKMQQVKEKLEEIRERSDDIAQNGGEYKAYDACDIIRGLSMEALSIIAEMEGEEKDNWPRRRMEIMSTRLKGGKP